MSTADVHAVPSVLWPMFLRSGWRYRSLRRHNFTPKEMVWISKNLADSCDDADDDLYRKVKLFCDRYDLSSTIIIGWLTTIANDDDFDAVDLAIG